MALALVLLECTRATAQLALLARTVNQSLLIRASRVHAKMVDNAMRLHRRRSYVFAHLGIPG